MADEVNTETTETAPEVAVESEVKTGNETALTKADIEKLIQSNTDRVRTEYSKKLKEIEAEKEELRKQAMSEKERAEYEKKQKDEELKNKEVELTKRELTIEATDILKEKDLDISFRKYVVGKDIEETKANIEEFKKFIDERVNAEVLKRNKDIGRVPEKGGKSPADSSMTRNEFDNLTPEQKAKIGQRAAKGEIKIIDN